MKAVLALLVLALTASPLLADPWTRLRNASANELCWDTSRGFAREKYPTVQLDDAAPALVNLTPPVRQAPFSERREKFAGIRDC